MVILLTIVIVIMAAIISWQFYARSRMNRDLHEISNKIADIIAHETAEKVLVPTGQETIRQLLIQVNRLLDYNQKVIADYARAKSSQRKMISNMSHDLKTPLTVILGYTEKLNQGRGLTEQEEKQITERLNDKVNKLIALLNQFFDLVKLESDDYEIPLHKISLSEVCRQSVLEYYDLLLAHNLRVELEIPERPFYILGNEQAMHRVLSNLISNAIRYGRDGGVVGVTVREEGEYVAVDVWDRGRGIAELHQERVFERLYTLDDARNPQFQGSGLGLSISKRLTEEMKGTIRLSSVPFQRTVFTCLFRPLTY
ncbi:signal transduction histidine kinase [Paenibacillus phyllosphaerae]|uniref:histidine kinase n=1 Tax=Paenibacillus phyllosphaerae TaxID=274593 RepID=A0A7W5B3Y8_9BACL|nr:sensor histidine kinase [Paenibacillus phyllosphaerae]MBB3113975.1 signal transduction histidine kinase [Paenibacillus phyllosphaerae]